jgi:hypothetical protein
MSNTQTQSQIFQDICKVTIEMASAEDLIKALKWILTKERMEKDLDLDASIKITYFTLAQCNDTECYKSYDSFEVVNVREAEVVKWSRKVDERRWENIVVVIPKKFADSSIVLKHENEYGTHYHTIYRTGVVDPNVVNGWKERIIYEHVDP